MALLTISLTLGELGAVRISDFMRTDASRRLATTESMRVYEGLIIVSER